MIKLKKTYAGYEHIDIFILKIIYIILGASTSEAQVRVAVEVAEQFIALTGTSKIYTQYMGVVNRDVLKNVL